MSPRLTMFPLVLLLCLFCQAAVGAPQWHTSLAAGGRTAREKGTPILVYCFADGNMSCRLMQEIVFQSPAVAGLSSQFTLVALRSDTMREDLQRVGAVRVPTTIVYTHAGKELVRYEGFVPAGQMAMMLRAVTEGDPPPPASPSMRVVPGDLLFEEPSGAREFTVGPDGRVPMIRLLSPYLQGEANEARRTDPIFRLEVGEYGGAMIVVYDEVSEFGLNSMDITVNGRVRASRKLAPIQREDAILVELEPGFHEVQIRNTGNDWVRLNRFEFHGLARTQAQLANSH